MKIAISGKGGVGKTLLAASLAKTFNDSGYSVIAIDADPAASLAATIGFPGANGIVPLSEMKELIAERTGAVPGQSGGIFRLNPKVDDIPEKFSACYNGIRLMVMGQVKRGGSGCYCAEHAMLQSLITHLLLGRKEVVIIDMEAGIEHLGRGTARAVDKLIVVVEPGRRSIETAEKVFSLAAEIGIEKIAVVGNKVRSDEDRAFIAACFPGKDIMGYIPYDPALITADINGQPILEASSAINEAIVKIFAFLQTDTPLGYNKKLTVN
jgi:CO dehydrogenase maturation factor